jgi:hypothetical protein
MNLRRNLLACTIAGALSACGATSSATTEAANSVAITTTAAPSTTAAPTTTVDTTIATSIATTTPPPTTTAVIDEPTVLTGTDWQAIVQILGQRRQALYAAPVDDPAAYDAICAGGDNPCTSALRTQIASLAEQGFRIADAAPFTVLPDDPFLENVEDGKTIDTARIVTVVVTIQRSLDNGNLVDDSGTIQAELESDTPEGQNLRSRITLVRTAPGNEWRILEQSPAGQVPA